MGLLHVAIAADLLGDAGDLDREPVVVVVQRAKQIADSAFVIGDQLPFQFPLRCVAEDVERGAAQAFEFRSSRNAVSIHGP